MQFLGLSMINALGQNARCLLSPPMQLTNYRRLVLHWAISGKNTGRSSIGHTALSHPYAGTVDDSERVFEVVKKKLGLQKGPLSPQGVTRFLLVRVF